VILPCVKLVYLEKIGYEFGKNANLDFEIENEDKH